MSDEVERARKRLAFVERNRGTWKQVVAAQAELWRAEETARTRAESEES